MELLAPPWVAKLLRVVGLVMASAKYQKTLFVGSPCTDEGTVGLLPGVELRDVAPVLQQALDARGRESKCNMVVWKDFPDESAKVLDELKPSMGNFGLISYPGTRLPLTGPGFEPYLKTLKGSRRHNLKKKIRKGEERGKTIASVVQKPDDATLQEVFSLFWQTYEKGKTKFETLNIEFFRKIAAYDVSHFILLRHADSNKLAAFMLCFALGDRAINKFIGIDYTLGDDWFLYFRLWREFVEWGSRTGAKELQSGQTGYRAKLDVGHTLVPLTNFCKNLSPFFHGIFEKATRDVKWETIDSDLAVYLKAHGEEEKSET
jgi:hypothetical protein